MKHIDNPGARRSTRKMVREAAQQKLAIRRAVQIRRFQLSTRMGSTGCPTFYSQLAAALRRAL